MPPKKKNENVATRRKLDVDEGDKCNLIVYMYEECKPIFRELQMRHGYDKMSKLNAWQKAYEYATKNLDIPFENTEHLRVRISNI